MTTTEDLTVVDAVALRRFDEPTMIRVLAARYRGDDLNVGLIPKKSATEIARRVAGSRSVERIAEALVVEVARQGEVHERRQTVRDDCEDLLYYDPVVVNVDRLTWEIGIGHSPQAPWARLAGLLTSRLGGYDGASGLKKILPDEYSYSIKIVDTAIVAGKIVGLVQPSWRDNGKHTQRSGVTCFLVVAPRSPRHKGVAIKVAPSVTSVSEGLQSVMPAAAVKAVRALTLGLGHPPHLFSRVELDWKNRRFGVWHNRMRKWHPFRKVGITPEGATRLGWGVVDAKGDSTWLRAMT